MGRNRLCAGWPVSINRKSGERKSEAQSSKRDPYDRVLHRGHDDLGRSDLSGREPACDVGAVLMMWENPVYRDRQQDPVVAYCSKCGGEIYAEESIMPSCLCRECWEEDENG